MSAPERDREPVEQLAEEFAERYRRGERPSLTEYVEKYPELGEEIRELFPALVLMEQFAPDKLSEPLAVDGEAQPLKQLGEYRILREIGRGGMGVVYEAVQESLGRHVALKVLPLSGLLNPTYLERFRREARAAARLHHTNIVPVFGVGQCHGVHYYAMQFIDGQGLDAMLRERGQPRGAQNGNHEPTTPPSHICRQGGLTEVSRSGTSDRLRTASFGRGVQADGDAIVAGLDASPSASTNDATSAARSGLTSHSNTQFYRDVAQIGIQVAEALAYAHQQGVVHRDIKPSNLLLDTRGTVWITDFGLAKAEGADELTSPGDIVGTIRYMAPERFQGQSEPRSDVYGLGMTLYESLTLRPAFDDVNRARLIERILHEHPPRLRKQDPRIPRDLETIVLKAIAKDPADRYSGAAELAEDLRRFVTDRPIQGRRSPWTEKAWRWCRRNRAVASLVSAVLLLLLAIAGGGVVMSVRLDGALSQAHHDRDDAQQAERFGNYKLWESYLSEARARRLTRQPGQRFGALRAIRQALALPVPPGHSLDELRTEAVAALLLPDIEIDQDCEVGAPITGFVTVDPSFERYALGDQDGKVSVRRLHDGVELIHLPGFGRLQDSDGLEFSPDGKFLHQAGDGKHGERMHIWRLDEGQAREVLAGNYAGHAFSPDSKQFVAHYPDRSLRLYDLENGREVRRFQVNWPLGVRPCWNPMRPLLAVGMPGGHQLFDLTTGRIERETEGPSAMDWHPNGRVLLGVSGDPPRIHLWDTVTQSPALPPLVGHKALGVLARFDHSGDRVLSTDWNGLWRLWDARTGELLLTQPANSAWMHFSPDDSLAGIIRSGSRLGLFRICTGREITTIAHHNRSLSARNEGVSILVDHDGRLLAVSTDRGSEFVDLWRGELVGALPLPGNRPLCFERSGALVTHGMAGVLRWPLALDANGARRRYGLPNMLVKVYQHFGTDNSGGATSSDANLVAIRTGTRVDLYRRPNDEVVTIGPHVGMTGCAVSPDGLWVATSGAETATEPGIRIWETSTGAKVAGMCVAGCGSVLFSPDGSWLVGHGSNYALWKVGTWQPGPALSVSSGSGAAFAADGSLLAVGEAPGVVALLSTATGKLIVRLSAPESGSLAPWCFTPDSARLVCLDDESQLLKVFDLGLIRGKLADIGLDWQAPPLPQSHESPMPRYSVETDLSKGHALKVEFRGIELATPREIKRYERALALLALALNPLDPKAHAQLGNQLLRADQPARAFAHLCLVLLLNSTDTAARRDRAMAAFRLGQWRQTVADANGVLALRPGQLRLRSYRGRALQKLNEHAAAIADFSAWLRAAPQDEEILLLRATSYAALGVAAKAEADRKQAEALLGRNPNLLNSMAWHCVADRALERNPPRALALAHRAVEREPDNSAFLHTLGVVQYRNGLYHEALGTLVKGLATSRGSSDAYHLFFLAMCHHRLGNPSEARECFDQAVRWLQAHSRSLRGDWAQELAEFRAEAEALLFP